MWRNALTPELLCFYLLIVCRIILGDKTDVIVVNEDGVVILPCSPIPKENLELKLFDWRKDRWGEVFIYNAGSHYNNGHKGQDAQFQGRVSHFPEELENGNASIKIKNVKLEDGGNYTCVFPHLYQNQKFHLMLVVKPNLRDRSCVIPGASPKPNISVLETTEDGVLLQCEVQGASPKPRVEWWDSGGNILPAEDRGTEREGRYNILLLLLLTTVTKTGSFSCVVTQEDIGHRITADTFVPFNEKMSEELRRLKIALILFAVLAAILGCIFVITSKCQGLWQKKQDSRKYSIDQDSALLPVDPPPIECEPKLEAVQIGTHIVPCAEDRPRSVARTHA